MTVGKRIVAEFPVPGPGRRLPVIYYLRRADGAIKIGMTRDLTQRKHDLEGRYGPLELLIWEPGGREVERALHRQFRQLRLELEWFHPGRELLDNIALVRTELLEACAGVSADRIAEVLA